MADLMRVGVGMLARNAENREEISGKTGTAIIPDSMNADQLYCHICEDGYSSRRYRWVYRKQKEFKLPWKTVSSWFETFNDPSSIAKR